jgi:sugar phosphate isomerase/epimerase
MDARNVAASIRRLSDESLDDAVARAKALGISAITFSGTPNSDPSSLGFFWPDLTESERALLLEVRDQFERAVIHAPFVDTPFVSVNPYIERESLRQVLGSIEAAGALRLEVVTIHAGIPHYTIPDDEFIRRLVPILRRLGDAAAENGTTIGVENWRYPADPDQHSTLLDMVDHPAVCATVDLGHVAYWYKRDGINSLTGQTAHDEYNARLLSLIDRLGERIVHIHAHDVHPADIGDHNPVGSGIIDYDAVIGRLERIGFDGLLLLEVKPNGEPYESVVVSSRDRLVQAMSPVAVA